MASSANTAKTMQICLEKKYANLENLLSTKLRSLDLSEAKIKSTEENLALVIDKKDKQSDELNSYKNANDDLKAQLWEQDKKLKESDAKYRTVVDKINYYESTSYTAKVIDVLRGTPEYDQELFNNCNTFFDRGCAQVLRNFHQFILDKTRMCQVYLGT